LVPACIVDRAEMQDLEILLIRPARLQRAEPIIEACAAEINVRRLCGRSLCGTANKA
jgi:hypothetical protein